MKDSVFRDQQNLLMSLQQNKQSRTQMSFQHSLRLTSADWIKHPDPTGTSQRNDRFSQNSQNHRTLIHTAAAAADTLSVVQVPELHLRHTGHHRSQRRLRNDPNLDPDP